MTILIAPDKFKGSLSAQQVCDAIREGIEMIGKGATIIALPLADGGEGTCELLTTYSKGIMVDVQVRDPLFRMISSGYGISSDGKTAFLEMAKASGLQLLKKEERNPMLTSTVGTGDLIRHALDKGVEKIIMGIGGSATNDAGMGMAEALGINFYSRSGEIVRPTGKNLKYVDRIDRTREHPKLKSVEFTIFCDVDNPLHGLNGAAHVFAKQKGANAEMIKELNEGLVVYESVLERTFHTKVNFPGAGAGGGLPATIKALTSFTTIRSGMDFIIDFIKLEDQVRRADLIITGEGKIDEQTLGGKVVRGVADLAAKYKKPVVAIAGKCELDEEKIRSLNLLRLVTLMDDQVSEKVAIEKAYELIANRTSKVLADFL